MSFKEKALNKKKYEKNLKQRLKKLFANDLIENNESNSTNSTLHSETLNESFSNLDFPKVNKLLNIKEREIHKENLSRKSDSELKNQIKTKSKNPKSHNNLDENSKKKFLTTEKNNDKKTEKWSNGPIATGYILNGLRVKEKKRKNESHKDLDKTKINKSLKDKGIKKSKLCSPNDRNERSTISYNEKGCQNNSKHILNPCEIRKQKTKSKLCINKGFQRMNIKKTRISKIDESKSKTSKEAFDLFKQTDGKVCSKSPKQAKKHHIQGEKMDKKSQKARILSSVDHKSNSKSKIKSKSIIKNQETTSCNDSVSKKKTKTNKKAKKKQHNGIQGGNCSKTESYNETWSSPDPNYMLENFSEYNKNLSSDEDWINPEHEDYSYSEESSLNTEDESLSDSEYENSSYLDESTLSDEISEYEDESDEHFNNDMKYNFESESNDEEYKLPESEEDLYIPQGIATKYDFDENMDVEFDSDRSEPQVIELPQESVCINNFESNTVPKVEKLSIFNQNNKLEMYTDSDSSCPQLIPIDYTSCKENVNVNFSNIYESASDSSSENISDCCSQYSEATEGSLCSIQEENILKEEASKMKPEIFELNIESCTKQKIFADSKESNHFEKTEICVVENILSNTNVNHSLNSNIHIVSSLNDVEQNSSSIHETKHIEHLKSKFYNGLDSRQVVVLLKEKIHIYGTLKLQLLAGSIDIFGYKPCINECVDLYSPKGYSFLSISTCKNNSRVNLAECLEKFKDILLSSEITEILHNFDSKVDAVLLLEKNYSLKRIEFLGKHMKENLFPSMNPMQIDRPFYASEFILRSIIYSRNENELIIDPKWQTVSLATKTRLMIIGGKSVGKSTCLRYIINKEIKKHKKILLVDLDVGQSEAFIPQTISATILKRPLLGPGYFANLKPNKAFVYGDVNIVLAPERYLQNIKELSKYCLETEELQNIPWIINTMGYSKGFGSELIAVLCHYLRPTDILQLQSENIVDNFDYLMEKEVLEKIPLNVFKKENLLLETPKGDLQYLENLNFEITTMKSVQNRKTDRNDGKKRMWKLYSKDSRYAMLIVRLGTILGEKFDWLTDVNPVCCCIDDIKYKSFNDRILSEEEFLDIINANLVYMCSQKDENKSLECFGIGIVRGIDKHNRKIYLISSVSKENLCHINCLSICSMPLPSSVYLNQGPKIKGNVPYAYNTNLFTASKPIKNFTRLKPVSKNLGG